MGHSRHIGLVTLIAILTIAKIDAQSADRHYEWIDEDGSQVTLSVATGLTAKLNGTIKTVFTPAKLDSNCSNAERYGLTDMAALCDRWAELKPKTEIERLSFVNLVNRLMLFSAPSTDFARYTGMQLKSDKTGIAYDALLVPNDLGNAVTCTLIEGQGDGANMAVYQCVIKTASYAAAVDLQRSLVSQLKPLGLVEDHAMEHGMAVSDKDTYKCSPNGACEHTFMYVSVPTKGRRLEITASPDFLRDPMSEIMTLDKTGHDAMPYGVSLNSGFVTIQVLSAVAKDNQAQR
jgi:hypothetical protein